MCKYCERREDVQFGWDQPPLPYTNNVLGDQITGNITDFSKFEARIHDYQTKTPELILTCKGYFDGEGIGTIYVPIHHCVYCGRKLGKKNK